MQMPAPNITPKAIVMPNNDHTPAASNGG